MNTDPLPSDYLSSQQFGALAGLKKRSAILALSNCHSGKTWRSYSLHVVAQSGRGGASGLSYLVRIDSLPSDLQRRAIDLFGGDEGGISPPVPAPIAQSLPALIQAASTQSVSAAAGSRRWQWISEFIRPAMVLPKGSPERGEMIRQLAQTSVLTPNGGRRRVSETTIRQWLAAYEARGLAGLERKDRADRGRKRVLISREWDSGFELSEEAKALIVEKLRRHVRSLWAAGVPGWRNCARMATAKLVTFMREARPDLADATLLALCEVPRAFVEAERDYSIIATKDKDAKKHHDTAIPRVRRSREGLLPMALVVGDVHHTDILFQRPDGSVCTPKAIAWTDVATNRVFMTLVFLAPGEGVRQKHVTQSFINITQHPEWGMPQALYLDNGGEFSKLGFVDDAMKLADLAQTQGFRVGMLSDNPDASAAMGRLRDARRSMVIHAQPYNASAKTIEGIFAVLEGGAFAMLPGWIGGDRMKSKTQNVGRAPAPFPGSEDEFRAAIGTALDYYHTNPQSGALKGKSPREALAAAIDRGWKRIDVDRRALEAVFAKDVWRVVTQGEVTLDGVYYRADELLTVPSGSKVRLRVPIAGDNASIAVLDEDGKFLCLAQPSPTFSFFDPEGAKDKQSRGKVQTKAISVMRSDTVKVDLQAELAAAAALAPLGPAPQSGGMIRLSDELEAIAEATSRLPAPQENHRQEQRSTHLDQGALLNRLLKTG